MIGDNVNMSKNLMDKEKGKSKAKTATLVLIGLMAAITCIIGPFSIPLPFNLVPISLTNLVIYFTMYILGMKKGTISYCIYLLIGLVGLPVFSAFTGGAGKLLGPTGGYLIGFIFLALISGFFIDKWGNNMWLCMTGMVLGTIVCYIFGTIWLAYQAHMNFGAALWAGVIPFILGDLIKMVIAMLLGPQIRNRLRKAGVIE